jgi:hypothetical protein
MEYYRPVFDDLARLESFDKIISILDTIVPVAPKTSQACDVICYGYYKAKRYVEAAEYGEKALGMSDSNEQKHAIRFNLAKCYQYANEPVKALNLLKLNTRLNPSDLDSRIDYCVALYAQNKKDEAEQLLRELLKEELPDKVRQIVNFNLGVHDLRKGDFREGMQRLLAGRELTIWGSHTHKFPIPEWNGVPYPGKRILIVGEGGIGDEIINLRFVNHIRQLDMIPSWASAHGLASAFGGGDIGDKCTTDAIQLEHVIDYKNFTTDIPTIHDYDFWVPAMNLPAVLGVVEDDLWYEPYLQAPLLKKAPTHIFDDHQLSNDREVFSIGLRWSGNPLYEQDLHRTIPAVEIYTMLRQIERELHAVGINVDINVYSLQRDHNLEAIGEMPGIVNLAEKDVEGASALDSIQSTLWCISRMDTVISSCTSIVHMSGALGVPTVLLTPVMSYYTWANGKRYSPWYQEYVTVLHQTTPKDWSEPLADLYHTIKGRILAKCLVKTIVEVS